MGPTTEAVFPAGVLSEEQIRKKKIQKQQQQQPPPPTEPASGSSARPAASPGTSEASSQGSGEGEGIQLTAAQELMIQQLVAAQLQCNKRSFSDQPKVTVSPRPAQWAEPTQAREGFLGHTSSHVTLAFCVPALALGCRPSVPRRSSATLCPLH